MQQWTLAITAALGMILTVANTTGAAEFYLVRDGKPAATIVLPARTEFDRYVTQQQAAAEAAIRQATPDIDGKAFEAAQKKAAAQIANSVKQVGDEEKLAAQELQQIIEQISGATLPIVTAADGQLPQGPVILIGSELATQAGLGSQLQQLHKDGLIAQAREGQLILSGQRARGTLYAVYELLESLGCRWVMPGAFGEIYPSQSTVSTQINTTRNPTHSQRYFWCTYGAAEGYARWSLRNKGNFIRALGDPTIAQGHALSQPLRWGATQEKYRVEVTDDQGKTTFVLPDEHYALHQGKLSRHTPNFANPRTWELYADYYIEYFNSRPHEKYVSISAEDGFVIDEHPASRSLASNDYDYAMGASSSTDQLWFFHNRVIERVTKVHPDRKFGVLVYANNMMPPRIERVHPNMALVFAPLGICPLHHVRDEKCKTNRSYRQWLEDWMAQARASGAETYYYDYEPMGYCWNMAMICPRWGIIGRNYPWFHELGLTGHTTQGYDDWASSGLNNYLMQRLYWDATQDYKQVIADYATARFGAAAPALIEYYDLLEARMAQIPDLYSNEMWANHLVLTPDLRAQMRTLINKAVQLADTERAKAHVHTMVLLQRSTDAACDAIEHADETGDFGAAAKMMQTIWDVRAELNQLYPNFMNATRLDEKARSEFFTGGVYNQYIKFDQRIHAAKAAVLTPRHWKGMLDTRHRASTELAYQQPAVSVDHLEELDTTICPDVKFGAQREVAAYFYRTEVDVPASFAQGTRHTLYFPSIIAKGLQVWINGQPVVFDNGAFKDTTWRGPDYFWINYNHEREFDITGYLEPGQKNVIAMRIFKSFDFGGTYRRVYLLAD